MRAPDHKRRRAKGLGQERGVKASIKVSEKLFKKSNNRSKNIRPVIYQTGGVIKELTKMKSSTREGTGCYGTHPISTMIKR